MLFSVCFALYIYISIYTKVITLKSKRKQEKRVGEGEKRGGKTRIVTSYCTHHSQFFLIKILKIKKKRNTQKRKEKLRK